MQKFSRKKRATLIVATTHKDLRKELAPDVYVDKEYKSKLKIEVANEAEEKQEPSERQKAASKETAKGSNHYNTDLRNGRTVVLRPRTGNRKNARNGSPRQISS
jgi:hypothetical protein